METLRSKGDSGTGLKWAYYKRNGSNHCICVLNSRGSEQWEWYRTVDELDLSVLHIADQDRSWYHSCIEETNEVLARFKPKKLVGASMGGYAALLFGALHNIDVVAFGPQTTIKCEWDDRWTPEWNAIQEWTKYPQYLDLWGMKPRGLIYYCHMVAEDVIHAKRIKTCKMKPRGCDKHSDEVKNINPGEIFHVS